MTSTTPTKNTGIAKEVPTQTSTSFWDIFKNKWLLQDLAGGALYSDMSGSPTARTSTQYAKQQTFKKFTVTDWLFMVIGGILVGGGIFGAVMSNKTATTIITTAAKVAK